MSQDSNPKLLLVDDEPLNLNVLVELFKGQYRLAVAKNGEQALQRAKDDPPPDLILLDIMMPGLDGYEVCRRLREDASTREVPVIFVTAMGEVQDETKGLELGAVDYITKPISPPIVQARVKNHLELKLARQALKNQNILLEQKVAERTRELRLTQDVTIQSMASLAESRDNETGGHIRRTQLYVEAIARHLSARSEAEVDERTVDLLIKSAPLHDMGKVGIPDHILLKPGKLTEEEFDVMKTHPQIGRDALLKAEGMLGDSSSFLRMARDIAYTHHEKWDGTGYPKGLRGEEIPLVGRIMAIADVYDALISKRVYKPAFPHEKAVSIILEGRGQHFDPELVDVFVEVQEEFRTISARFQD
ncbi:MAG: two-component system response regulator [Armatimonadetes bacterium]|nr:two-component system response regulator [Armatimonadota bacterium]